jgi:2-polyprenyl-6-hydroxyphenyl methylase/3-demethylubiquinone-9 3-methyltransferase
VGPLHQINPVRVKYIRERVIEHFAHTDGDDPAPLRGLRVADVGCGGGVLSEVWQQ